ncbi:hypothetical protein AKJ16_DCAP22910 [Drosera capensis]
MTRNRTFHRSNSSFLSLFRIRFGELLWLSRVESNRVEACIGIDLGGGGILARFKIWISALIGALGLISDEMCSTFINKMIASQPAMEIFMRRCFVELMFGISKSLDEENRERFSRKLLTLKAPFRAR